MINNRPSQWEPLTSLQFLINYISFEQYHWVSLCKGAKFKISCLFLTRLCWLWCQILMNQIQNLHGSFGEIRMRATIEISEFYFKTRDCILSTCQQQHLSYFLCQLRSRFCVSNHCYSHSMFTFQK